jgi:hypothetical protein
MWNVGRGMNMTEFEFVNDALPAKYFEKPPYHVETFSTGLSCVCNSTGFNCLTFASHHGIVLTRVNIAKMIAEKWNKQEKRKAA